MGNVSAESSSEKEIFSTDPGVQKDTDIRQFDRNAKEQR